MDAVVPPSRGKTPHLLETLPIFLLMLLFSHAHTLMSLYLPLSPGFDANM